MKAVSLLPAALCGLLAVSTLALAPGAYAAQDQAAPAATQPDNTARNKAHNHTADQQSEATTDRTLTQQIRKAIVADKSLSTYAHNVKIITRNGMVTLKGPVKSEDEKTAIAAKAADAAGGPEKVTDQLTTKH